MPQKTEQLATARDVASRYGVTVETIQRWVRQRRIPFVRPSRRVVRFILDDVDRAVRKGVQR